jgi:hypothetical protein
MASTLATVGTCGCSGLLGADAYCQQVVLAAITAAVVAACAYESLSKLTYAAWRTAMTQPTAG